MLDYFNANQYKQFHRLKAMRQTCKRMEKDKKDACYRILSFDNNLNMIGIMYADEARELRKIIEYRMRKLIQEVMHNKRYRIGNLKTYEEISAELARSCERAIEVLRKIEGVTKDKYVDR